MSDFEKGWKAALELAADWIEELFEEMGDDATKLFLEPGRDPKENVYEHIRNLRPDAESGGVSDARIRRSE